MAESDSLRVPVLDAAGWVEYGFGTRFTPPLGIPLAVANQVHSATVVHVAAATENAGEADALVTQTPGLAVGVKTADCVPILLADYATRAVAAIHAGWRGSSQNIAAATLRHMRDAFGTVPEQVIVAIGPAIGKCCFEVGPEVAREFLFWDASLAGNDGKVNLDLSRINRLQFIRAGVPAQSIDVAGVCTMCRNDLFFSFRKEREQAGRMISWIAVREKI